MASCPWVWIHLSVRSSSHQAWACDCQQRLWVWGPSTLASWIECSVKLQLVTISLARPTPLSLLNPILLSSSNSQAYSCSELSTKDPVTSQALLWRTRHCTVLCPGQEMRVDGNFPHTRTQPSNTPNQLCTHPRSIALPARFPIL